MSPTNAPLNMNKATRSKLATMRRDNACSYLIEAFSAIKAALARLERVSGSYLSVCYIDGAHILLSCDQNKIRRSLSLFRDVFSVSELHIYQLLH